MRIAVVILNWNGVELLKQFLPEVVKHTPTQDIYLVDNHSQDDSVAYVKEMFPNINIVQNLSNEGYAKGYNLGLSKISADIYCLLNSDVWVTPNWIEPVKKLFKENENIAVIQPKILNFNQKDFFDYAGAAGGFIDFFGYPFCRGRIFNTIEKDKGQYDSDLPIFWASGACFFVRSEIFHQLSGFDEDFFAHQEEIDFCWRIHHLGKKVYYTPNSTVYHLGGGTLSFNNPLKVYLNFRNSLFVLLKNLPIKILFFTIFFRLILDAFAGLYFLIKGKPKFLFQIIKAHFSFYSCFFRFYDKRKKNNLKKYAYLKSIVFDYFIRNKKNFSELLIKE